MKVLLLNCPIRETSNPNVIPTGLAQISSILKKAGHETILLDINGLRLTQCEVEAYIQYYADKMDLFGISGLVTTYKYQRWLISCIQRYSQKPIVCGGGCASVTENLLIEVGASQLVIGAGENQIMELIKSNTRYNNIDDIPFPDWNSLPMSNYLKNPIWGKGSGNASNVNIHSDMKQERSINVITSRGCPYKCKFCYDLFGQKYEQRSVDNVISEIQELKRKYNIDFVGFTDDNMFVNEKWILEFCNKIGHEGILWGCHARVNEVNDELLNKAYYGGCRWIGYGIESGSQKILDAMNKKITVKQAREAIELTRKHNIYPNTSFIYGYPGEDRETIDETIQFCKDLNLKPNFFHCIPYPDCELYRIHKEEIIRRFEGFENFIKSLGEAKDFVINLTAMSDEEYWNNYKRLQWN